jgi:methionine biosynthesis protein MetW
MSDILQSRVDFETIVSIVKRGSKVLDVGCGDGELLELLQKTRDVDGRGVELSQSGVNQCVSRGLSVIQGDADTDLVYYMDKGFDYVILSQTLQATRNPRLVLEHMLRIGNYAIVSIPNFGHWRVRLSLLWNGRMPVTKNMPYSWYDTPNIHFCTIDDFIDLCHNIGATIEHAIALNKEGERTKLRSPRFLWNLFGAQAVFLIKK